MLVGFVDRESCVCLGVGIERDKRVGWFDILMERGQRHVRGACTHHSH